ncbi:sel1 repeat family protein, partial [Salmonella enterica]|nr:sel1 repeat family protein [Salmonella enterica]
MRVFCKQKKDDAAYNHAINDNKDSCMRFSSIFKIIILNIFISKMAHSAVCEERYP